jgi:hypothetical protein
MEPIKLFIRDMIMIQAVKLLGMLSSSKDYQRVRILFFYFFSPNLFYLFFLFLFRLNIIFQKNIRRGKSILNYKYFSFQIDLNSLTDILILKCGIYHQVLYFIYSLIRGKEKNFSRNFNAKKPKTP